MQRIHVYVATVRVLGVRSNMYSYNMYCKTVILGILALYRHTYRCTVHCADTYKHTLGTERYKDS